MTFLPKNRGGCDFFWAEKWAEAPFRKKSRPPQKLLVLIFCGGCDCAEGVTFDFWPFFAHFSGQKSRRVCLRFCRSEA